MRNFKILIVASILMNSIQCYTIVKDMVIVNYVNSAVTHFETSLTICAPNLTEHERLDIRSNFAKIKNSNDYIVVMNRLQENAKKNNQELPKFSIW